MRFPQHAVGGKKMIDLVPVVNVVLLLMFFFLLSWSFVLKPGVEVRLPTTSLNIVSPQGRHVITLKATKDQPMIFFDEKSVDEAGLRNNLREVGRKSSGEWITLNADETVSHGNVQRTASMAMEQGFRVSIATQRVTGESSAAAP